MQSVWLSGYRGGSGRVFEHMGGQAMFELRVRTMARAMTYRVTAWVFTVLLTKVFVGDIGSAAVYSTILHVVLGLYYYVHERIWLRVKWGTKRPEVGSLQRRLGICRSVLDHGGLMGRRRELMETEFRKMMGEYVKEVLPR